MTSQLINTLLYNIVPGAPNVRFIPRFSADTRQLTALLAAVDQTVSIISSVLSTMIVMIIVPYRSLLLLLMVFLDL